MTKTLWLLILIFLPQFTRAAFSNYKSILIGNQAAGMGGAFTALTGDSAGCAFYNPATLARMSGTSLSASVSVYNKYETRYGNQDQFSSAALRVNQGSIVPIPSSSGSVYTFRNFALGLSIVFPDFDHFAGEVSSTPTTTSYANLRDQSLWVGGSVALNVTEASSVGLTMYYTSRSYNRSAVDQTTVGGVTYLTNEEKIFSQNSLIYILGYHWTLDKNWRVGLSSRLPSLPISGRGSYYRSDINNQSGSSPQVVNEKNLHAQTLIPAQHTIGIAYLEKKVWTLSLDASYHDASRFRDFQEEKHSETTIHKPIWNYSLGGEAFIRDWLAWRMGLYTNFSSHPEISETPQGRTGDHVDMWGFSTNLGFYTSPNSQITLGGYYSGGKGHTAQLRGQKLAKVEKSQQIFSFLVGTSFQF